MATSFYLRSVGVLGTLYSLVLGFFVLIAAGVTFFTQEIEEGIFATLPLGLFAFIALLLLFLQFLISPFLMDLQLSWVYDMDWVHIDELPAQLANAMKQSLDKHGVTLSKIGIIYDNMPNAFTYGHFKKNARVVFTEGILNLLEPEEQVAVMEHELGHIVHLDFVFMTLAQAVPLLFYYTYITLRRVASSMSKSSGGSSSNKGGNVAIVFIAAAVLAYLLYRISRLAILLLSRYREHYADEFSAYETQRPQHLSTALVKISYGMVVADAETQRALDSDKVPDSRKRDLRRRSGYSNAIRTMGLADVNMAKGLVMQASTKTSEITAHDVAAAASWDLITPWAKFIELQSTHPLTGKRLKALDNFAHDLGQKPQYPSLGDVRPPESLWDEFFVDLFALYIVPWMLFILPLLGGVFGAISGSVGLGIGAGFIAAGIIWYFRVQIKYPGTIHSFDDPSREPNTVVEALTSMARDGYYEASPVRGKPILIEGQVQGRGTPGFVLSEDFMVRDQTGFIVVDYNSVIPFYNLIFGYRNVRDMMGEKVKVVGWYHRSIKPYITLFRVYRPDGRVHKNRWRGANLILVGLWIAIGLVFLLGIFAI